MSEQVCVCECVVCTSKCTYMVCMCVCMYVCMWCVSVCVHACVRACVRVCAIKCVYVMCIYLRMCMCVCVCVCVCMHTYVVRVHALASSKYLHKSSPIFQMCVAHLTHSWPSGHQMTSLAKCSCFACRTSCVVWLQF